MGSSAISACFIHVQKMHGARAASLFRGVSILQNEALWASHSAFDPRRRLRSANAPLTGGYRLGHAPIGACGSCVLGNFESQTRFRSDEFICNIGVFYTRSKDAWRTRGKPL